MAAGEEAQHQEKYKKERGMNSNLFEEEERRYLLCVSLFASLALQEGLRIMYAHPQSALRQKARDRHKKMDRRKDTEKRDKSKISLHI